MDHITTAPEIQLIEPTIDYEQDIWQFREELIAAKDQDKFAGCGNLEKCLSAREWIDTVNLEKAAETCPKDKVPSRIYIAVRKEDNRIVGVIDLRYHIHTPILSTWGGHMGYSVRPTERRKRYATEMLRQNLQNCKAFNIRKVLVTCSSTNSASEKAILENNGIFEKSIEVDGDFIKRYWITIT